MTIEKTMPHPGAPQPRDLFWCTAAFTKPFRRLACLIVLLGVELSMATSTRRDAKDIVNESLDYSVVLRDKIDDLRRSLNEITERISGMERSLTAIEGVTRDAINILNTVSEANLVETNNKLDAVRSILRNEKVFFETNIDEGEPPKKIVFRKHEIDGLSIRWK